ncbi:MAG: L,D-transpeptidase [Chthoniobacterales bacterium]|nr:L,D-transpeptidase [Chthoniobacterales bacterium]
MHDTRSRFGWIIAASLLVACGCSSAHAFGSEIVVSIADQELALIKRGRTVERYPISTSKFGNGDGVGTYRTPLGVLYVSGKVGDGLPPGTVIKSRVPTGEVIAPNSPGRDPIVARVLWLRGKEEQNRNARERCIYIHGTAEERRIGRRASYGCIRMRSKDVIALYRQVHIGTRVVISEKRLAEFLPPEEVTLLARHY